MINKLINLLSSTESYKRYSEPKIIIFAWTRTGSSNLGEILKALTQASFIYEPFHPKKGTKIKTVKQLKSQLSKIWKQFDGLKHVTRLDRKSDEYLLLHPDHKIIFLWRENISKRVVSELLGRQTKNFGSLNNNKALRVDLEKVNYKDIDLETFEKTCENYKDNVNYFKQILRKNNKIFFEVKFEDLFENDISSQKDLMKNICGFLNVDFQDAIYEDLKWRFEDKMKQSSNKIYESIPNINMLQKLIHEKGYGNLLK
jgi:hypothetical protein